MDTETANLKMYFDKLVKTIETQSSFKFGDMYLVDKQRIDDILCCIDANFPHILKAYHKKYGDIDKAIKSFNHYNSLIENIKIKPPLGNNSYLINYNKVIEIIAILGNSFASDIKYINENYSNLNEL